MDFNQQLDLLSKFIGCSSVTYKDDGKAIDLLIDILKPVGFRCTKLEFKAGGKLVYNLYAEYGNGKRNLCFAGHADVVSPGDVSKWSSDPFVAEIKDGNIYGRGVVDMKGSIVCFVAAVLDYIEENSQKEICISFLIGGDEEEDSKLGTVKLLEWLEANGKHLSHCIVGEPTNTDIIGESVKVGRRGSINFFLTVRGIQGHMAYPQLADNAATKLIYVLDKLKKIELDNGSELFSPSNLEVSSINIDNQVTNVIPGIAKAVFNIRYNDNYNAQALVKLVNNTILSITNDFNLEFQHTAEVFYTKDTYLQELLVNSIKQVVEVKPVLNSLGGTSDARFIHKHCPVIEFGLSNKTAHKVDEHSSLEDIVTLTSIYKQVLINYFK